MKREEIKTYKDACKVIGRKPRTYKDKYLKKNYSKIGFGEINY